MAAKRTTVEFSIVNSETAELIVKICFLINDLKHTFGNDFIPNEKNCLRCDHQILQQMDAVLGSNRLGEFRNRLKDFIKMTDAFIEIYTTTAFTFSEKKAIEYTLKHLSDLLKLLDQKTKIPQ